MSSTRFESLSNEILLDILEYLDAYHLCQTWYGLNTRIDSLLQSVQLHLCFDQATKEESIWDTVVPFFKSPQIRILSFVKQNSIHSRISINSLKNLRTLNFCPADLTVVKEVCETFPPDNQLKCLSVRLTSRVWCDRSRQPIVQTVLVDQIHRFLSLTHLSFEDYYCQSFPLMSVMLPHLRYLSLANFSFSHEFLQSIQTCMPNLRSLKFKVYFTASIVLPMTVEKVHELDINIYRELSHLERILPNFPSLRRLRIVCQYQQRLLPVIGPLCQRLIDQYLPHLKQLTIDFEPSAEEKLLSILCNSDFWSKRRTKAKTIMCPTRHRCPLIQTISFGQEWRFRYFDNLDHT